MALEYQLCIDTQREPTDLCSALIDLLGVGRLICVEEAGWIHIPPPIGLSVYGAPLRKVRSEILQEELGIGARVELTIRLSKAALETAGEHMVRGALGLLRQVNGDATLLFQGETVYFVRKGDTIFLQQEGDWWTSERVALVGAPYAWKSFGTL